MFTQCIAPICTIAAIVLAILLMTRTISLEDALKQIGKMFLLILLVYMAICILAPPVRAGLMALRELFSALTRWLLVSIPVIAALTLGIRALMSRRRARSNSSSAQEMR